jgi:anti-sigma regulatory factor (Ser/Thr protein kinase)
MGTEKQPSPRSNRPPQRPSSKAKAKSRGGSPGPSSHPKTKGGAVSSRAATKARARILRQVRHKTLLADRNQLPSVCDFVYDAAAASGFDDRTNYACQLAVCEAVENIIQHGYRADGAGKIRVSTDARPGKLTVEIVDDAPAFDPSHYPVAPGAVAGDPPVGGRGLLMIRRVMDAITYERRSERNVLRLTKNRPFIGV